MSVYRPGVKLALGIVVKDAKVVARQWVADEVSHLPGFSGAFLHGSMNWLADDATIPATSDVDVMVVMANDQPLPRAGKFIYRDVLLEASALSMDRLQFPEMLLGDYQLATSFRMPGIIADPTGQLARIQAVVSENFTKHVWVRRRCEDAQSKAQRDFQSLNAARIFPDQALGWLFGAGKLPHILLVAGLHNPTVRRRYVAAYGLLRDYGQLWLHKKLLELLGCSQMSQQQAEHHLFMLTEAFDAAQMYIQTPFSFASDIAAVARPIAIDGSREMIEAGYHREAVFWMAVTYSRCQVVLHHDAPANVRDTFNPGYRHLLNDLGIASPDDLWNRSEMTASFLPQIREVAEAIRMANPAIED